MKEEFIVRVLGKASGVITIEQAREMRDIMRMELIGFDLNRSCTALAVKSNVYEKIAMFLHTKDLLGLSKSTLGGYKRNLISFATSLNKNIEDATEEDINKFLYIKKRQMKASSLNTVMTAIRTFVSWLAYKGYIAKNIMFDIKPIKTPKRVRKCLTKSELEQVRYAGRNIRDDCMIEIFYSTGCRLSEIQALSISDLDLTNGDTMVIGKGDKERRVYLTPKSVLLIKEYLLTRKDRNDALFVGQRDVDKIKYKRNRLGHRAIQRVFSAVGKLAGLNRSLFPHLMRHTFATHRLQAGTDLYTISELMGHSDVSSTQIYAVNTVESARLAHGKAS